MQLMLAAILALTPLVILPGLFFYYDVTPKVVVVLIGTAMAGAYFVGDQGFSRIRRLWADPAGRWLCLLTAAQVFSLLLSTALSAHPALAWNGGNWRRLGFVSQFAVILCALLIATYPRLRILARAVAASGLAIAVYGILQYFGLDALISPAGYSVGEGVTAIVRPPSTLGHADYYAGDLLYVVFFGALLHKNDANRGWRAVGFAAWMAAAAGIVLSGTRGALLGLGAGAITLWLFRRPQFTRRAAVLAGALCAAGMLFYVSPAGLKLRARTQWAMEDLRGGARLWLWRDSLRMASHRWIAGYGPETFGLEFPRSQSVELSRAYPDFLHESPHSIYLDAFVSQGVIGLVVLFGFVALGFVVVRRHAAPYLPAALVAALVSGIFICFTAAGSLYFYATLAMVVGSAIPEGEKVPATRVRWRVPQLACAGGIAAALLYFAVRLSASDLALERSDRDLKAGRIEAALSEYRTSLRWHLKGSGDDLYFSRAVAAMAPKIPDRGQASLALQTAFVAAMRATATSEEPQNAWYNLAEFYAARNDSVDVEKCLRRAIAASPNWFKPHWALAQLLAFSGRRAEALAQGARAADLDGGREPEIANFLQTVHQSKAGLGTE